MDKDSIYLAHINEEIQFLKRLIQSQSFEHFQSDEVMQRASIRSLEVIGEAVKNLSVDCKLKHPGIEWKKISGLRDVLIHQYFGVDLYLVWDVLQKKIPELEGEIGNESI